MSAQIGEELTCVKCLCEAVISGSSVQSLLKASLAAETTGGEILVAFWPKHGLKSDLRVPNFKKIFLGEHALDPPSLLTLMHCLPIITMAVPI